LLTLQIDNPQQALWAAALRDAAGLLAAYITPPEYGLSSFAGESIPGSDPFERQLRRRLDLGRAHRFAEMLSAIALEPERLRRRSIRFTRGEVLGTIHVPRYIASLAAGATDRIPVLQSRSNLGTPENQLIAEGIARSLSICKDWMGEGGAEAAFAGQIHQHLTRAGRQEPWRDIMTQPRPPLRPLAGQVRNLVSLKVIPKVPYWEMSALLGGLTPTAASGAFTASAGLLALFVTSNPQFEDKMFELLCLAWIINAISRYGDPSSLSVFPDRIKASKGLPLVEAKIRGRRIRVHFQSGVALPVRNWRLIDGNRELGAIFDILCRLTSVDGSRSVDLIIDAKNRGAKSEGEVAYKMLGYKENVTAPSDTFRGIAVFPATTARLEVSGLKRDAHRLWLVRVPLGESKQAIDLFGRFLRSRRLGA
jgi:hypothetical protein